MELSITYSLKLEEFMDAHNDRQKKPIPVTEITF